MPRSRSVRLECLVQLVFGHERAPGGGLDFSWISLDSLVRNETFQWVTRLEARLIFAPRWSAAPGREKAFHNVRTLIVHARSIALILIFRKESLRPENVCFLECGVSGARHYRRDPLRNAERADVGRDSLALRRFRPTGFRRNLPNSAASNPRPAGFRSVSSIQVLSGARSGPWVRAAAAAAMRRLRPGDDCDRGRAIRRPDGGAGVAVAGAGFSSRRVGGPDQDFRGRLAHGERRAAQDPARRPVALAG